MSDVIREREQSKEITLVETISDEALEAAAGAGSDRAGQYTLFYCTAWTSVPALDTTEAPIAQGELARRGHSSRPIVPSQATRDRAI